MKGRRAAPSNWRAVVRIGARLAAMIDPLLALSFNLHSERGTYALLLGSGVSRSAGVPTGWEVTLDLISKLAHLRKASTDGDPASWYKAKYRREANYSEVLAAIAPTTAAQQQLLKGYFEPSEQEREQGLKRPTDAHRAIAKLVVRGTIRIIVTTNFDRLLESALEAEGIAPVVIASADAIRGAPPLAHSKCTIIKVHGDYMDSRVRNSPEALEAYDKATNKLLEQVFDEYGLIVSGWSGDYDVALRAAMARIRQRRYPIYWTTLGEPATAARDLINLHRATTIEIEGADRFFPDLLERVEALEAFDRPHPLSVQAALAALKRYLSEERFRIQLHDLLADEALAASATLEVTFAEYKNIAPAKESVGDLLKHLEAKSEKLVHLFAHGAYFSTAQNTKPFADAFTILAGKAVHVDGYTVWANLRRYPCLLLIYAVGISALASGNCQVLKELASTPIYVRHDDDKSAPAPVRFNNHKVLDYENGRSLLIGKERRHTAFSDYLFEIIRPPLEKLAPDPSRYERLFDDFEYLWALLAVDAELQQGKTNPWPPYGAFAWRRRRDGDWLRTQLNASIERKNADLALLKCGLFGGEFERLRAAIAAADPILDRISMELH